MKFNPGEYDYLWSDHDVDFIFVSCYISKNFRKNDIVLIYKHKEKELQFFLSKKSREKLSKYALLHYTVKFRNWEKSIRNNISNGKKLIKDKKDDSIEGFIARVELFQNLIDDYFFTEFFFMDKVEKSDDPLIRDNIKKMGTLKFEARSVLNNFYNHKIVFYSYLKQFQKEFGRKDLRWLSWQELTLLNKGNKIPISKREKVDWVLSKKNNWDLDFNRKTIEDFNRHFFKSDISEFKGTIANKGIYDGKAKIIRTIFSDDAKEETKKFRKGDVLVAQTTGPELMHIIHKAGAIVTDEGGLSSHAAIVARELNIPCIVGTKIASKTIKDNERIFVDANKGIIKIIK